MEKRRFAIIVALLLAVVALSWGFDQGIVQAAQSKLSDQALKYHRKITPSERKAATASAAALGFQLGVTAAALVPGPDGHLIPDYFGVANWAYSPPLRKFVNRMPVLTVATPDTIAYPGSDYYEIALQQYTQKMHSSLPATTLRGYVQINNGTDAGGQNTIAPAPIRYMGPIIVAQKDRPVRIKFVNQLPIGAGGNLFIPVDPTVMGAGMGPDGMTMYTQNRATVHLHGNNTVWISDGTPHQWITPANETTPYPQGVGVHPVPDMGAGTAANDNGNPTDGVMTLYYTNAQSARLMFYHDHAYGITRLNVYAGEAAGYLITDAVESDLINGTNNTGVNPGLLKVLPDIGIPLVIQDKTFVNPNTIGATDPTWLDPTQPTFGTNPGTAVRGDLWYPHVYMPNQNPWDPMGMGANAFGRWDYGPWFYPPVPANALVQWVLPNPYCLPTPPFSPTATTWDCSAAPWEPPFMPGTPSLSEVGEAFMDTPVVNGKAYPYLSVEPKAYRFRILNASDDRFVNLQMYVANPGIVGSLTTTAGSGYTADPVVTVTNAAGDTTGHGFTLSATADLTPGSPTLGQVTFAINSVGSNYTLPPVITVNRAAGDTTGTGAGATAHLYGTLPAQLTEVGMVPTPEITLPNFDVSGVPDPAMAGPNWWHIGTEGGFSPSPVVVPNQHITWNLNPKTFNFGNVVNHSLLLGTAERADVIVDFSAYAGKTIILYNDAPAAFPAIDPRLDYYTNDLDQTAVGGAPTTQPGFGPNTRTIMQIRVGTTVTTPTTDVTLANLQTVWAKTATKRGVFEASQDPIIIPQAAYNSAYDNIFTSVVNQEFIQVGDTTKTFQPIDANGTLQAAVTLPIKEKATHDEMGGVYDRYGRMSGMLGLSLRATTSQIAQFLPYGYISPPVDLIKGSVNGTLVGSLNDGTQIWRITQNGVDTHTIHIHLANAQLINRVGWDGMMIPPDPIDLGWKETFRVNPLEQTFIAMRPFKHTVAQVPFLSQIPNSVRLIDPTMPVGVPLTPPPPAGWFDPSGNPIAKILNHKVNFGSEYVYHCHILAHEENDMMHSFNLAVPPKAPSKLVVNVNKLNKAVLAWTDNSANETSFKVQKKIGAGTWTNIWTVAASPGTGATKKFTDPAALSTNTTYYYRVRAINVVGDTVTPGFPTMTVNSNFSNIATLVR
jgi:FtsP/CotA-like multicopper oxidase with cupredoxin domain